MVKKLAAMKEIQVQSLGWDDPLEKGTAPTPVILPREFHGQRSLAAYSPWDHKESEMIERLSLIDKNNPKALGSTQNVKK